MALHGTLRTWHDDRGFGFIAPSHGGREVFVHISAFPPDGSRPTEGEQLSYELGRGRNGDVQAVKVIRSAIGRQPPPRVHQAERRVGASQLPRVVGVLLVVVAAALVYTRLGRAPVVPQPLVSEPAPTQTTQTTRPAPPASSFRCDGRKHCSEVTSCDEAKYFHKNCPDTQMDGDHDGIPCEQQWCTSPFTR